MCVFLCLRSHVDMYLCVLMQVQDLGEKSFVQSLRAIFLEDKEKQRRLIFVMTA